jgi:hypothetical protein
MDKKHCIGCRDDYYNHDNRSTTGECWRLRDARLVTKYAIGWWTPMDDADNFTKIQKPSCYHQPGTMAYLDEMPGHLQ